MNTDVQPLPSTTSPDACPPCIPSDAVVVSDAIGAGVLDDLRQSAYLSMDSETVGHESARYWDLMALAAEGVVTARKRLETVEDVYNRVHRGRRGRTYAPDTAAGKWRRRQLLCILRDWKEDGKQTPFSQRLRRQHFKPAHARMTPARETLRHYQRRLKAAEAAVARFDKAAQDSKSGLHFWENTLQVVQAATDNHVYLIKPTPYNAKQVQTIVENKELIIGFNLQFDIRHWQHHLGWNIRPEQLFDCYIAERMIQNGKLFKGFNLKDTMHRYFGTEMDKGQQVSDWRWPLTDEQVLYAYYDVKNLHDLYLAQKAELESLGLVDCYRLQVKAMMACVEIERNGLCVDRDKLDDLVNKYQASNDALYEAMSPHWPISWRSNTQLKTFLEEFFPDIKDTQKKTLQRLTKQMPALEYVLEDKQQQKMLSTYLKPFQKKLVLTDNHYRIHGNFNPVKTETSRLSGDSPNLQNLPADEFRQVIVPKPNCVLVNADLSSIEPRVLGELSQDQGLISSFINNEDCYLKTAALMYNVPYASYFDADGNMTAEAKPVRKQAKVLKLATMYGRTKWALADELGITVDYAEHLIKTYYRALPDVKRWMDRMLEQARTLGFVQTVSGWIRYLPDINSTDKRARERAERQVINTIIQGSSADMMKESMLILSDAAEGTPIKPVMTLHDELMVECPFEYVELAKDMLEHALVKGCQKYMHSVPVVAEPKVIMSWAEAK